MSEIKNFYKEYEDVFEEYLEDIIGNLKNKNEKYKQLQEQYYELLRKNKNLNWVLEGQNEGRNLNNYECKMLFKLVQIFYEMKEIEAKVDIPLVLHGGSNNPDKEIGESVTLGICKINISSDIKAAYFTKMREVLLDKGLREPGDIEPPCMEAMKEVVKHKLDLFQTTGKAVLY